jgi:DNA replication and repair protein RecF
VASTLDVWDAKLADVGEALAAAREKLVGSMESTLAKAYDQVAQSPADVVGRYQRSWEGSLRDALVTARPDDVRRSVTTVGPHRDELMLSIGGMPARTHASQGEQRSLALALRLATHEIVTVETGDPPILLLDDVFSELVPWRSEALLAHLPAGQAILTTAGPVPTAARPARVVRVSAGVLVA